MACFALELEREVAQLEAQASRSSLWWKAEAAAPEPSCDGAVQRDQAPPARKAAVLAHPPVTPARQAEPPQVAAPNSQPSARQPMQQQPQPQPQAQPAAAAAVLPTAAAQPDPTPRVVHLQRQTAVRTHSAFLRRVPAARPVVCTPSPGLPLVQAPTAAAPGSVAHARPAAPAVATVTPPAQTKGEAATAGAGAASGTRSSSAVSERIAIVTPPGVATGPCSLARHASCDSDHDAFNSATGPSKDAATAAGPAASTAGTTRPTAPRVPPAAAPVAGAAPPAPWVGGYLDVADGADDVAFGGRKRFVRHDQEDVVEVVAGTSLRLRPVRAGGARLRHCSSAPAALSAAVPSGAAWPASTGTAAAGGDCVGETAAAAAWRGGRGSGAPPAALGPRTMAALAAADGCWGSQDSMTAGSATGSPTAAMVATMQPHDLSLSPMVLPPGCSIHGGAREAPSLSPSPLPAWQPRSAPGNTDGAPLPLHSALPPMREIGSSGDGSGAAAAAAIGGGACALLAGAFPTARSLSTRDEPSPLGAGVAGGASGSGGAARAPRRSRMVPIPPAAASAAASAPVPQPQESAPDALLLGGAAAAAVAATAAHLQGGGAAASTAAAAAAGVLQEVDAAAAAANESDSEDIPGRPKKRPAARLLTRPHGFGCVNCGATSTPVWRTGPSGPKTLCNRCGVRFSKMARRNK